MSHISHQAKPLSPDEVAPELRKYVDFNNQFQRPQSKGILHTCVHVTCPICSNVRPVMASAIRTMTLKNKWTAQCRTCLASISNRDFKIPDWVQPAFRQYLIEDSISYDNGFKNINVICPFCGNSRRLRLNSIRTKEFVDQLNCRSCSSKRRLSKPVPRKVHAGYVHIFVNGLEGRAREIASQMQSHSSAYIREHRLVMALHLDRPLTKDEIVHHRNGTKDDNRINNLILLTKNTHHVGHGHPYYQQWQEAESRIKKLEARILKLEQLISKE